MTEDDRTSFIFDDKLQIAVRTPEISNALDVDIILFTNEKKNPYAKKVAEFLDAILNKENIFPILEVATPKIVDQQATRYIRTQYQFSGCSSEAMRVVICNVLTEVQTKFRERCPTGAEHIDDETRLMIFTGCLDEFRLSYKTHLTFEQKLKNSIAGTIRDFYNKDKKERQLNLNDKVVSRALTELVVAKPQCTSSDIEESLARASGAGDLFKAQIGALAIELEKTIKNIQQQRIEEIAMKTLDAFLTRRTKLSAENAKAIAKTVAGLGINDAKDTLAVAKVLHEAVVDGDCGDMVELAGRIAEAVEKSFKPQIKNHRL